jgi:drug/metabolite transporter (DMT)-like permease
VAPASVLQPFNYTSLPWALLISALIFHEPLDTVSLGGAAIIVGAGLVVMARERIRKVPTVAEPTLPGKE